MKSMFVVGKLVAYKTIRMSQETKQVSPRVQLRLRAGERAFAPV